jgi:hypothetical protein
MYRNNNFTGSRSKKMNYSSLDRMNRVPLLPLDSLNCPSGDRYVISIQPCNITPKP